MSLGQYDPSLPDAHSHPVSVGKSSNREGIRWVAHPGDGYSRGTGRTRPARYNGRPKNDLCPMEDQGGAEVNGRTAAAPYSFDVRP